MQFHNFHNHSICQENIWALLLIVQYVILLSCLRRGKIFSLFPNLGDPRYLFAVEVTLRQNIPEELFLNDDPDSLMIEETSTLGLPNISDITRFQIELENSSSGELENN